MDKRKAQAYIDETMIPMEDLPEELRGASMEVVRGYLTNEIYPKGSRDGK